MANMERYSGGKTSDKGKAQAENMLKNLNDSQSAKLMEILSDPEKSQEILNSPVAKSLMKKLENNG
jgi:uncharacterized protein (DUF1778 family)